MCSMRVATMKQHGLERRGTVYARHNATNTTCENTGAAGWAQRQSTRGQTATAGPRQKSNVKWASPRRDAPHSTTDNDAP